MSATTRTLVGVATAIALLSTGTAAAEAALSAHGSVRQVYVTDLDPGARVALLDSRGRTVATRRASKLGGLVFRNVRPGSGYRVRLAPAGAESDPLTVLSARPAPPDTKGYDQALPTSGYGYLTTRDGTKLAINVHPPQDVTNVLPEGSRPPATPPGGATPTLIEYSGYGYANPAGPESGIAIIANLMGFTVVDVNMRGTGCSGGAFDFFEPLQGLDGYDIVETVARQPWVAHNKVGMMGISYGGISQLFTAATNPPSLAAISPLSVIDATQTTLYPGGILNTGFALAWAKERIHDAKPATEKGGQPWAHKRIQEGDKVCKANQALHSQAVNLLAKIQANSHYKPKVADPLAPVTFVKKIKAPVFMACQFTDEQTGGHCPTLAAQFTGTDRKWFTFTNGTHVDSLAPETFNRWYDFLQLYVAQQAPSTNAAAIQAGGAGHLPGGDGDPRRHAAPRPDPAGADLRGRAGGLRAAQAGPDPVRQRRRRVEPRRAQAGLRAVLRPLPDPGHEGAVLVLRSRRHAGRPRPGAGRRRLVRLGRQGAAADRLHRRHGRGRRRPVDGDPALRLAAEPSRQRGLAT